MKRETFKEMDYWDKRVEALARGVSRYEEALAKGDLEPDHRLNLLDSTYRARLKLLVARYSRGEAINEVAAELPALLAAFHRARVAIPEPWNLRSLDDYVEAVWLLSLAILFDADASAFQTLVTDLGQGGKDGLYDRLVASRQPGAPVVEPLVHPKPYQPLLEALAATPEQAGALVVKFLKQYYAGMKKASWHDTHLAADAGFFGYWCFELAALVKVHRIDDTLFADNLYYPRDLVQASAGPPVVT